MDSTKLRTEYTDRSWDYELPDPLEQALEDDYVQNRHLYADKTFKCIKLIFALDPEITPNSMLKFVRALHKHEMTFEK